MVKSCCPLKFFLSFFISVFKVDVKAFFFDGAVLDMKYLFINFTQNIRRGLKKR